MIAKKPRLHRTNSKKSLPEVTIIPANVSAEAFRLATHDDLSQMSFWKKLTPAKQGSIRDEVKQLTAARMMHTASGLAMGKHLRNIYDELEDTALFRKLINTFSFVERTAYRYIDTYDNVRVSFPEEILKVIMARGMNILSYSKEQPLGKYTEAYRALPPPKNPNSAVAKKYVEDLERTYKQYRRAVISGDIQAPDHPVVSDRQEILKSSFRAVRSSLKKVSSRSRRAFLEDLVGMMLTEAGIQSAITFQPEAIPDDFRQGPGRPRNDSGEEESA